MLGPLVALLPDDLDRRGTWQATDPSADLRQPIGGLRALASDLFRAWCIVHQVI
jgi:hypothetical protein